jgi:thiamine transport system substrate-binding protein
MKISRALRTGSTLAVVALTVSACSTMGGQSEDSATSSDEVVLVTHESFVLPKKVIRQFEDESGYDLVVRAAGDAGTLTNKLVLTKEDPTGDVAFGVDNTFASRALEEGVFAPYSFDRPAGVDEYDLPGDDGQALTPVDNANVCVNVDDTWFAKRDLAPPATLDDLTDPAYRDLFVLPGAATSSPGMAFLLATIAEYGDPGWQRYWEDLMANGTRVTAGWTDAYSVDFTAGGGGGDRPIVLSYASSPPFTIPEGGDRPTTSALMDTCYRQVEYAGVLDGAQNPEGAEALVDFMLSKSFQSALPDNMYVFPVVASVELPPVWARWAKTAKDPLQVDPAQITENRDDWLTTWGEITTR